MRVVDFAADRSGSGALACPARVFARPAPDARTVRILEVARREVERAGSVLWRRDVAGIADFGVHSSLPRFHFANLEEGSVTSYRVAHGTGSDPEHDGMLDWFSNEPGSLATSRGAFISWEWYKGIYGTSIRLGGLDADNSNALDRAIVMHAADYARPQHVERWGRLGRSNGCFAMAPDEPVPATPAAAVRPVGPGRRAVPRGGAGRTVRGPPLPPPAAGQGGTPAQPAEAAVASAKVTGVSHRVFLHVGLPKSGTTYIQAVLGKNKSLLRERSSLLYPGETWGRQVDAVRDVRRMKLPPSQKAAVNGAWERLVSEMEVWPNDSVVSMEWLCMATPGQIQRIAKDLAPAEVHVVFTVRDVARTVPAAWQEFSQNRSTWRWPDFLEQVTSKEPMDTDAGRAVPRPRLP